MSNINEDLPLVPADDGFDDYSGESRLIQGTILRCNDGHWMDRDKVPLPPDLRLLALKTALANQRWKDKLPIETVVKVPGANLPDLEELNKKIPKKDWEVGLDGEKRAPWVRQFIVYLFDPKDASAYTFINSTVGAMIAVERLKERVHWKRKVCGESVIPIVSFGSASMPTKKGVKIRPEFVVEDWVIFGGTGVAKVPALEHLGTPVTPSTTAEILNDEIPLFDHDDGEFVGKK